MIELGELERRHEDFARRNARVIVVSMEGLDDAKRTQALRRLLMGKPPKKLVLLTATPVNNSLWDLYYLLTLFIGHDAVFAE